MVLTTLESRRLIGDQYFYLMIMRILIEICSLNLKKSRTRRHKAALVKEQCMLDVRKYTFSR